MSDSFFKFIIDKKYDKVSIILPVDEYKQLLEDIHDLAVVVERRDESCVAFKGIKDSLGKDGLI